MQLSGIISVLVAMTPLAHFRPSTPSCSGYADIVFVVDTSTSIWSVHFENHVRPFVRDVVNIFDVGSLPTQTRVGLVTFSDTHHLQFYLDGHATKQETLNAIMNMPRVIGNTNTSDALRFVTMEMFTRRHGGRDGVPHVVVVLTDGKSQDYDATSAAARAARLAGINTFAIGVGDGVDRKELTNIASEPSDDFVFQVTDFEALDSIKNQLADKACHVTTAKPVASPSTTTLSSTTTTTSTNRSTRTATTSQSMTSLPGSTSTTTMTPETAHNIQRDDAFSYKTCGGKPADVYFVLDSSASIDVGDFNNKVLSFVRNVSEILQSGNTDTRVGVMSFSNEPRPVFGLDAFTNLSQLLAAISPGKIPFLAGGTNTAAAIRHARLRAFAPEVARPEVAHVMVIITDGQSRNPVETSIQAKAAKHAGIYVFAVGVGSDVDETELTTIASEPQKDFVFKVTDFSALANIKNLLAIRTCKLVPQDRPYEENRRCNLENSKIMFVLDSVTLGLHQTRSITSSLNNVMTSLAARTNRLLAGVKMHSCWSNTDIPLTEGELINAALSAQNEALYPRLASLMKDVRTKSLVKRGDLYHGRRVMVVLLNEASQERIFDVIAEAKRAKFSGVEVFVVSTGQVKEGIMRLIASAPYAQHVLRVPDLAQLGKVTSKLSGRLCGDPDQPIKLPPVKIQ